MILAPCAILPCDTFVCAFFIDNVQQLMGHAPHMISGWLYTWAAQSTETYALEVARRDTGLVLKLLLYCMLCRTHAAFCPKADYTETDALQILAVDHTYID